MVCKPMYLLLLWQASVETAEDYTKRKFVFRLHTSDGSEFLFSADSEDQQEEWVKKIRFHAALPPSQQLTQYRDFDETKENEFTPPEPHIDGTDFISIMWKNITHTFLQQLPYQNRCTQTFLQTIQIILHLQGKNKNIFMIKLTAKLLIEEKCQCLSY